MRNSFAAPFSAIKTRHLRAHWIAAATLVASLTFSNLGHAQELSNNLVFKRCHIQNKAIEIDAECATLQRHENPNDENSRLIGLSIVKLPSTSPKPEADAFTLIQGGPGGSSIDMAISYRQALEFIRSKRDIIIVDQRGTGRSNKLACSQPEETPTNSFDREQTIALTQQCISELKEHDLRYYTTSIAVQDLEAVRQAAGYDQLTVYGVSYGTRVAQHYLRRFPEQTRAIIIDGVVDIGLNLAGAEIARRSQDAFDAMALRCKNTAICAEQFGDIDQKFKELRVRLKNQPVEIEFPHPSTGNPVTHTVSEVDLLAAVRFLPYATETMALLPMLIARAHEGDYTPLAAQGINTIETLSDEFATGMHNSVVCAEDAPFVEAGAASKTANTYFGSDMMDAIAATCEVWPKGVIDDDFTEIFDSDKPVMILSGETDPITPPANGQRADNMFSNSKHLVVPSHGHGVVARGCVPYLLRDFIESADLSSLKTDCIERERAMPFFIDATGPEA